MSKIHKTIFTFFSIICLGLVFSANIFADGTDVVDEINVTVPVSCTMSGSGMTSHNADISNGIYQANIGITTLHAFCNDNSGFAIYAAGYTGDEIGATNSNKLVGTSASGNATIITGTATSAGNPDISNWAMKLTITQDSGDTTGTNAFTIDNSFNAYHDVPNSYTRVAHKNSGTDMTTTTGGVKLTTTYAAYISKTQPADTYSGQVLYTLVHPATHETPTRPIDCPAGYICYTPNADNATGTMNVQDVGTYAEDTTSVLGYQSATTNTETTLVPPNYKRVGYGFAGWNTDPNGNGTMYGPNEDFTPGDVTSEGIAMYAQWVPSSGNLQGWTGCSTLSKGQVIGLTDNRDGDVYAVSKLADGNCWMIENLRLSDKDANNNTIAINSTNTDNPASGFTALTASIDSWCHVVDNPCVNSVEINTNNVSFDGVNASGTDLIAAHGGEPGNESPQGFRGNNLQWYSYGNYYNFYTATAGNGTLNAIMNSETANGSICPNGWTLPTSGDKANRNNSDWWKLILNVVGSEPENMEDDDYPAYYSSEGEDASNALRSYPNNFVLSGAWSGDERFGGGYIIWLASRSSYYSMGVAGFYSPILLLGQLNPFASYTALYGTNVRCLATN